MATFSPLLFLAFSSLSSFEAVQMALKAREIGKEGAGGPSPARLRP